MTTFSSEPPGAVLVDREIRDLAENRELIRNFEERFLRGASYDLRLGKEYSTAGQHHRLGSGRGLSCKLEPGQFILLTSHERLRLPHDLVGHAGLLSKWAQSGLISLFSPQIDPGFEGILIVPLFNGGNAPITLRVGEPMFTVEFVRTSRQVERGWAEDNQPLSQIRSGVDVQMGRPNFSAIGDEIHHLHRLVSTLEARFDGFASGTVQRHTISSTKAGWLTLGVAIVALVVSVITLLVTG